MQSGSLHTVFIHSNKHYALLTESLQCLQYMHIHTQTKQKKGYLEATHWLRGGTFKKRSTPPFECPMEVKMS